MTVFKITRKKVTFWWGCTAAEEYKRNLRITIANQSLLKTGFRNASQVDVFSAVFSAVSSMARVKLF